MLAFRLRPPLRSFPSRAYSSPFLKNPPFARPYLWWTKARYRPDGSRRSILRGILHGAFYVSVTIYAFRQYRATTYTKRYLKGLSNAVELQRINRKYRGSTFTEPAEIKDYITDIAKTDVIPGFSLAAPIFCKDYEALSKGLPEYCEQLRKSICELSEHLAMNPIAVEKRGGVPKYPMVEVVLDVEIACQKVMIAVLIILAKDKKECQWLQGMFDNATRK